MDTECSGEEPVSTMRKHGYLRRLWRHLRRRIELPVDRCDRRRDRTYYLVVRANYEFIPDALGRSENSYDNNHAAVCIGSNAAQDRWWQNTWRV